MIVGRNGLRQYCWVRATLVELTSVTRQLLKICIFENFIQRSDEIVIGAIALSDNGMTLLASN